MAINHELAERAAHLRKGGHKRLSKRLLNQALREAHPAERRDVRAYYHACFGMAPVKA